MAVEYRAREFHAHQVQTFASVYNEGRMLKGTATFWQDSSRMAST